jgi:diguanylate cyclase (GGDEF)-like protein
MTLLAVAGVARAQSVVDVPFDAPSIDLAPYVKYVETDKSSVSVQLPPLQNGQPEIITLDAKGDGPLYRWGAVSIRNLGYIPADVVLTIPYQGFVGSGIFWPKEQGTKVVRVTESRAVASVVNDIGADSLAIPMTAGSRTTVAIQTANATLDGMSLWQRSSFDAYSDSQAFFRGAILGIAILMSVVMISLYAVRSSLVFPAAALFAFASVGFIALEVGYLPLVNQYLPEQLRINSHMRLIVEGLMLTGVILCLVTFLELHKRRKLLGYGLLGLAALSLGLPAWGWFEPRYALTAIRMAFAVTVIGGFLVVFLQWRQGVSRAQASLLAWAVLLSWTLVAMAAVAATGNQTILRAILIAGLTLVLLTMAFTLAQFAFSHGFLSRRFFEEAGRRALALAASQQYVWDWQVDDQDLYVGEEFERAMGLRPGFFAENGVDGLLELMHPLDRKAYISAIEAMERRAKGTFVQEFRLRGGDGAYRWFELRGKVMGGSDRRAMRCIGTLVDATDRKRTEDRLLNDAVYDRITELPNRALLVDRLDRAILQAEQAEIHDLYVLLVDIDRFKALNDGLGQETGDNLLAVTGRRILSAAGPNDTVARMPGDQFAVIFMGSSPARDVLNFTDELRRAVSRPIPTRPHDVTLTASIGVAAYRQPGQNANHMLRDAAVALYEAKRRGKNAVEFFRASMRDERSELVALEQDLLRAVERGEIEVFYQPIARLIDMDLVGFEALIRWRHPIHGLLAPESFIDIAEQSGLIRDLGRHVLNEAGRQLGIWQRAFRPANPIHVAINLSSSELLRTDLIEDVKAILAREGIVRDTFKIEVTESIVLSNPELGARILERLKELGIGLSCDDFGTGFSSLSTLRSLPFDTLKIDRSFVEAEPEDTRSNIILSAIAGLARELGMKLVAEGISTQGQVDRLAGLGCDYGQGYFIGEPMPAKIVTDVLSGLPYSTSRGRSVIAALWERMRAESTVLARPAVIEEQVVAEPAMPPPEIPQPPAPEVPPPPPPPQLQPPPPVVGRAPMAPRAVKPEPEVPVLDMRKILKKPAPMAPRPPLADLAATNGKAAKQRLKKRGAGPVPATNGASEADAPPPPSAEVAEPKAKKARSPKRPQDRPEKAETTSAKPKPKRTRKKKPAAQA